MQKFAQIIGKFTVIHKGRFFTGKFTIKQLQLIKLFKLKQLQRSNSRQGQGRRQGRRRRQGQGLFVFYLPHYNAMPAIKQLMST